MEPSVRIHFTVKGGVAALEFYKAAFGAVELFRLMDPASGQLGHAEMRIGQTVMMLNDEYPDFGAVSPDRLGGSSVQFTLQVADADRAMAQAVAAGAVMLRSVALQFHGDRMGTVLDPFGYRWAIAQKVEAVSPEEMQRRWAEGMA